MDKIHSLFLGFGKNQENQQIQIHSDYASILANTEVKAGNAVDLGNGLILYKNSAGNTLRVQTKEKFEKTGNREGVEFDLKGNYQSSSDSDVLDRLQLPMNAPKPPSQSDKFVSGFTGSLAAAAPALTVKPPASQSQQQIHQHYSYAIERASTELDSGKSWDLKNGLVLYKSRDGKVLRIQYLKKFQDGKPQGVNFDLNGNFQSSSDSDVLDRLQLPMNAPQPPPQSNDAFQGSHSSAAAAPASSFPKAPEIRPIVQAWSNALITNNRLKTFETLNEFNKKATDTEKEARRNMIKFLFPFETGYYNISYENDILFTEGDYSGTRSLECINKNPYMLHSHYMDQPRYHSVTCNLLTGERHEKKYLGDPGKFSNFFNAP